MKRNKGADYVQKSNKYELRDLKKSIAELYLNIKQKTRDEVIPLKVSVMVE